MTIKEQAKDLYKRHPVITFLAGIFALSVVAALWYVTLPLLIGVALWASNRFTKGTKIKTTIGLVVLCVGLVAAHLYISRAPTIVLASPADGTSVQAHTINIKGVVSPSDSVLTINDTNVQPDRKGNFSYTAPLFNETNSIAIYAKNSGKSDSKTISVTRIYSDQEKADMSAAKLKAEQDALAAEAKAKADQVDYDNSKAGKLCKKHADWTKGDCEGVAKNMVWIGMTLDMVKAEYGTPDSARPSNYGSGVHWQWCWMGNSPSCFYSDDGTTINSYN